MAHLLLYYDYYFLYFLCLEQGLYKLLSIKYL